MCFPLLLEHSSGILPPGNGILARVDPCTNFARCFSCSRNLNNIDLLRALGYDFVAAVAILAGWLERHQSRLPKTPTTREAK